MSASSFPGRTNVLHLVLGRGKCPGGEGGGEQMSYTLPVRPLILNGRLCSGKKCVLTKTKGDF